MTTGPVELQATVAQSGELVLDDGTRLTHPPEVVAPQVRRLAAGQRVRLRLRDGRVTAVTLAGLPLPPG